MLSTLCPFAFNARSNDLSVSIASVKITKRGLFSPDGLLISGLKSSGFIASLKRSNLGSSVFSRHRSSKSPISNLSFWRSSRYDSLKSEVLKHLLFPPLRAMIASTTVLKATKLPLDSLCNLFTSISGQINTQSCWSISIITSLYRFRFSSVFLNAARLLSRRFTNRIRIIR